MNWNELRDRAYKTSVAHGWYKENLSDEHYLMLVITEVSEAVQADRKGKLADIEGFNRYMDNPKDVKDVFYKYAYQSCISGSIQDELADIVIRLLSLAGARNIDISTMNKELNRGSFEKIEPFTEFMYYACRYLVNEDKLLIKINFAIAYVESWCKQHDIDLSFFIEHKMRYNEQREYKHGVSY